MITVRRSNSPRRKRKCAATVGAIVKFCGHDGCFVADIRILKGVAIVHAGGPVTMENLDRHGKLGFPTHHIIDFPIAGFWNPKLGVFVVPADQVRTL